ncbi:hypothetical protein MRB53_008229 [Persea americana]|uniref:Uncharacterized protein n=1 Tax=Persea americana TaxID=3435 RepID=A0ACC2ML59_PERAE|nr:hypothetical protein MRB53_008229 [Persea americana]
MVERDLRDLEQMRAWWRTSFSNPLSAAIYFYDAFLQPTFGGRCGNGVSSGISLRRLNLRCCEVRQIGEGDFVGRRRTEEELERVNSILFGLAEGTGILFGLAANKSGPEKPAPAPESPL